MRRKTAEHYEGITRCACGSRYWDDARDASGKPIVVCHSCGEQVAAAHKWIRDQREREKAAWIAEARAQGVTA